MAGGSVGWLLSGWLSLTKLISVYFSIAQHIRLGFAWQINNKDLALNVAALPVATEPQLLAWPLFLAAVVAVR